MYQRVNITLPYKTIKLVDRIAPRGSRSNFIDAAIKYYASEQAKERIRKGLKAGAIKHAERDKHLAEEWLNLDSNVW